MRFLNGRYLLIPLLVVALALIVAACGDDEPDKPTSVTFMLDWTPNTNHAGIYIAKAKGWYEDAGLDVEIVEPGAGGVDQTVAAGAAHFGISVQENVIPAREQGLPVVAIAAVIEHNTSSLIALGDEGIEGPGDLAGKTYGGWGGALETALISKLVECGGGDPSTVEYAVIGQRRLHRGHGAGRLRLRLDIRRLGRHSLHRGAWPGCLLRPLHRPHGLHSGLVHAPSSSRTSR